jgi:hypothetical protein
MYLWLLPQRQLLLASGELEGRDSRAPVEGPGCLQPHALIVSVLAVNLAPVSREREGGPIVGIFGAGIE